MFTRQEGIDPFKLFNPTLSDVSDISEHKLEGIVPERELDLKDRDFNMIMLPKQDGIPLVRPF
jgi:hypothetical protein